MKIVKIAILILLLILPSISHAADIYKWVDKDGTANFTDDLSKVPPEYRDQVKTEEVRDSEKSQTSTPQQTQTTTPAPASVQKTEQVKESQQSQTTTPAPASVQETGDGRRDLRDRRDDAYWRERVRRPK